jgi:hypothetical protein
MASVDKAGALVTERSYAHLQEIDQLLESTRGASGKTLDRRLGDLAKTILTHCELDVSSDVLESRERLFDDDVPGRHRRFISICLLRLLALNQLPFEDGSFRVAAFRLFDDTLVDVYAAIKLDAAVQTYEKQRHLADVVPDVEASLREAVADTKSLEKIVPARKRLMQVLNSRRNKPILSAFLPRSLIIDSLSSALAAAEDFAEAEGPPLVEAHERAVEELEALHLHAMQVGTSYAVRFIEDLADGLAADVNTSFSQRAIGRPADVVIRPAEKKYPFHVEGVPIELQFQVQNNGPGDAFNLILRIESADGLEIDAHNAEVLLGNWPPQQLTVPVAAMARLGPETAAVEVSLSWKNADGTDGAFQEIFPFDAQAPEVRWERLAGDPYALEPVAREELLVGRDEILQELAAMAQSDSMGSALIFGQKRVGKTSIVRTLETLLGRAQPDLLVTYLEAGPYGAQTVGATVRALGTALCRALIRTDVRLTDLPIPVFDDGAFSPIIEFFHDVRKRLPGYRFLIIIDEFDELPQSLFSHAEDARAFFNTLRALTSESDVALILVGGEKMRFVLAAHGETFNRFAQRQVDYFDATRNWGDFCALVRLPADGVLEFADDAVAALYEMTAGHPFFVKMICREVARAALARRDAHVTRHDVEAASRFALADAGAPKFQHFWADGIPETGAKKAEVSMARRKLLLALAHALRGALAPTEPALVDEARRFDLSESQSTALLREFQERGIVEPGPEGLRTRTPFFGLWLRDYGAREIVTQMADADGLLELRRKEEEILVRPEEIAEVVDRWGPYQGVPITSEDVRAWLGQFEATEDQRLMFTILRSLKFFAVPAMAEKFEELNQRAFRQAAKRRGRERLMRSDLLVTYLDGAGKSGSELARLYRRANSISYDNVVERGSLMHALDERDVRGVIFVDDFVGSGNALSHNLANLDEQVRKRLTDPRISAFAVVAAGFDEGLKLVRATIRELSLPIRVLEAETLTDADRVFHTSSETFSAEAEREKARAIANRIGEQLEPHHPLGYEDSQAAVVFGTGCPNNSLPILWKKKPDWRPLFPRL